jgi:N-hydroxyarylamine O-acetyltransferase
MGYDGPRKPTLDTLRELHRLHPSTIPYENIEPFMGRSVDLAEESLAAKMIDGGRGGYCYENNCLLQGVLRRMGFDVVSVGGRVQWVVQPGLVNARTHMVLLVNLPEGRFIADVGFGSQSFTAPLKLDTEADQRSTHATHRVRKSGSEYQVSVRLGSEWAPIYEFNMEMRTPADWEVANWFSSTHPSSKFKTNLMAARAGADEAYSLLNRSVRTQYPDGTSQRTPVETAEHLASILRDTFCLRLTGAEVNDVWQQLARVKPPAPTTSR